MMITLEEEEEEEKKKKEEEEGDRRIRALLTSPLRAPSNEGKRKERGICLAAMHACHAMPMSIHVLPFPCCQQSFPGSQNHRAKSGEADRDRFP